MPRSNSNPSVSRRTVLRGAAGAVTAGAAVSTVTPVSAQTSDEPNYGGWFKNTSNYDGTVDKTGQQTVTIEVGAKGNNGNFAFSPAAVRVDPGTTVVWEWSGEGGSHNVVAEDGSFESEMTDEAGYTFEQTFEQEGIVKYACVPHKAMGMKGALVVDGSQTTESSDDSIGDAITIGGGLGLVGVLVGMFAYGVRDKSQKY